MLEKTVKILFNSVLTITPKQKEFCFRGSISIAGAAVSWLKGIGLINSATEVENCAAKVKDSGDVYFVPA